MGIGRVRNAFGLCALRARSGFVSDALTTPSFAVAASTVSKPSTATAEPTATILAASTPAIASLAAATQLHEH